MRVGSWVGRAGWKRKAFYHNELGVVGIYLRGLSPAAFSVAFGGQVWRKCCGSSNSAWGAKLFFFNSLPLFGLRLYRPRSTQLSAI